MTEFEFYSVAASIVLALALGKLISSIPSVFTPAHFDWVFGLFFVFALLSSLTQWMMIWDLNSHDSWSMGDFALLMAPIISLYIGIHVLISDAPQEIVSWRERVQSVHRGFLAAFFVMMLMGQFRDYVLVEEPISWFAVLVVGPLLVSGAILTQRSAHATIGLLLAAVAVVRIWGDIR